MATFENLAAALSRYAARQDAHRRAAIELLIWHEHWLRRADFQNRAVRWDGTKGVESGRGLALISWDEAAEFAEERPRASTSELAVLDLAVAIGSDRYRLSQMGTAHAVAIVKAFADALGVDHG